MVAALCAVAIAFPQPADPNVISSCLAVPIAGNARTPVRKDLVEQMVVKDVRFSPKEGEAVGQAKWAKFQADTNGNFGQQPFRGGYAYCEVEAGEAKTMLLEASGHSMVYVNGSPRTGDPYSYGYVSLPVRLSKGKNRFLFAVGRGQFKAKLVAPPAAVSFDMRDATLPDVRTGSEPDGKLWAGILLRNATDKWQSDLTVNGSPVATIPPMTCRKVPVQLSPASGGKVHLTLAGGGTVLDESDLTLRVVPAHEPYKVTFVSQLDGSVQYFAVNPASGPAQALVLSLHGASVEAIGQAQAYAPKSWANLVAPTNRRPFGFDWEDIGRLDALEVLETAKQTFQPDPTQVYLTGHSMGGHGTLQVGVLFPDKFAAIAPSAGWVAFSTYGGGARFADPTPLESLILRSMSPSDTLAYKQNYAQQGVYLLHGDADDNVPVTEARAVRAALEPFHKDLHWHEQSGAGHWWENSDERGAECVDWPAIFDLFARRRIPTLDQVRLIDFTTPGPGVSATNHWLTILQQEKQWQPSHLQLAAEPFAKRIKGTTENVRAMTLAPTWLSDGLNLNLDGQELSIDGELTSVTLVREGGKWQVGAVPNGEKSPKRDGLFKDIFKNRALFVVGTAGNAAENAWALDKAIFDAEQLWVRGNGSVDIVLDKQFDPAATKGRNVVLYGNKNTNSAYGQLVDDAFTVQRGQVSGGGKTVKGSDLAAFYIRPRKNDSTASVAVIGGTGIVGMRLCDRVPLFTSGASMPDVMVYSPDALSQGTPGMVAAGFFGNNWSVTSGEFAWQK